MTLFLTHSNEFIKRFSECGARVFNWPIHDGFCLVRPLFSLQPIAVYTPLISCTDLDYEQANKIYESIPFKRALIKTLAPENANQDMPSGAPVLMRMAIGGRTIDEIISQSHTNCRRNTAKARKSGLVVESGTGNRLLKDGHAVHCAIMHRHGTPALPIALFEQMASRGLGSMHVAYAGREPAAMLWSVLDKDLCWIPWCGALPVFSRFCPNQLTHIAALEQAQTAGSKVFDFGRSPMLSGTYEYKRRWGAQPVPVTYLTRGNLNIYGKYRLASALWKKLPPKAASRLGAIACRYLPEL